MKTIGTLLGCLSIFIIGYCFMKGIKLNQECTGYLEQAANANSVDDAIQRLNKAISYIEQNNLTHGNTSVFFDTPGNDIGFWSKNIISSRDELLKVDSTTTALEKSNLLIKLRETLMEDTGKDGITVSRPNGLGLYPHVGLLKSLYWLSILYLFFGFAFIISYYSN